MKAIENSWISALCLLISFLFSWPTHAQRNTDCDVWLEQLDKEIKANRDSEAAKMMKWFINCKGNELGNNNPLLKKLNNIKKFTGFHHDHCIVELKNGKKAIVNRDFSKFIELEHETYGFSDVGLARIKVNDKYGFINTDNEVVLHPIYEATPGFFEGLARVKLDGKYGFINSSGATVISLVYDDAGSFSEGLARVKLDGKYGFINSSGATVIPLIYDDAEDFFEGLASVKQGRGYGFINKRNEVIIDLKYEEVSEFREGLVPVKLNRNHWQYLDVNGKVVIPKVEAYWVGLFFNGYAFFSENAWSREKGFIDKTGKVVIPPIYDYAFAFTDNRLAAVGKDEKWGFITPENKIQIPLIYDGVDPFYDGKAWVKLNGKEFYIDSRGICVADCENAPANHP